MKAQKVHAAVLDRRVVKFQNKVQVQYLVKWEGLSDHESSWEIAETFEQEYPQFFVTMQQKGVQKLSLEDKTFLKGEGMLGEFRNWHL